MLPDCATISRKLPQGSALIFTPPLSLRRGKLQVLRVESVSSPLDTLCVSAEDTDRIWRFAIEWERAENGWRVSAPERMGIGPLSALIRDVNKVLSEIPIL